MVESRIGNGEKLGQTDLKGLGYTVSGSQHCPGFVVTTVVES